MFTNEKDGCTIWEEAVQNRSPTYVRHQTGAVYWEEQYGETSGKDRVPERSVLIIIPAANLGGYLPKAGDRITRGASAGELPDRNAPTVTEVRDLRYGSPKVQHVEVTAK